MSSPPGHVAAPFAGVVTVLVEPGAAVSSGQVVAVVEAMKLEAAVTAPAAGTVESVAVEGPCPVQGGDLLLVVSGSSGGGPLRRG